MLEVHNDDSFAKELVFVRLDGKARHSAVRFTALPFIFIRTTDGIVTEYIVNDNQTWHEEERHGFASVDETTDAGETDGDTVDDSANELDGLGPDQALRMIVDAVTAISSAPTSGEPIRVGKQQAVRTGRLLFVPALNPVKVEVWPSRAVPKVPRQPVLIPVQAMDLDELAEYKARAVHYLSDDPFGYVTEAQDDE